MESRMARQLQDVVVDETTHLTDVLPTTNAKDGSTRSSYGYNMAPWETTVVVDSNTTSAFTVYLPPVAEGKGKIYTISITDPSYAVTVEDLGDDSVDFENATLDAAYDRVAYYSDGLYWYKLNVTAN